MEGAVLRVVGDAMTENVVAVRETTPFREVAWLLARHDVNAVPVLDEDDGVIGIVSEADLILKQEEHPLGPPPLFEGKRKHLERVKAEGVRTAELMTRPAVTIGPRATLAEAARLLHDRRVKQLPVVRADGRLVGIISRSDLIKVFLRSDDALRRDVEEALALQLRIDPTAMRVRVEDGIVHLEGSVSHKSLAASIVAAVWRVAGVVDVVNHLTYRTDEEEPGWLPIP
jgi:CBS-domain-containing membrane protein